LYSTVTTQYTYSQFTNQLKIASTYGQLKKKKKSCKCASVFRFLSKTVKLTICTTICCCERGLKKKRKAFHPPIHTTQRVPLYYFVFQHKAMANYNNTIFIVPVHSIVALDKTTPNLLTALSMDASHAQGSQQQPSEGSSSGQQLTLVDISAKLDQIRNAISNAGKSSNEL
jgi:hypothetical protein